MKSRRLSWLAVGLAGAGVCAIVGVVAALLGIGVMGAVGLATYVGVGDAAPDFELTTLEGDTITLSQFRGQPVLLEMTATWCTACVLSAPQLQALHERRADLVIIGVDSEQEASVVQTFADRYGLTYPIVLDLDGSVAKSYRVWAIPTLFFIDSESIIQAILTEDYNEEHVQEALAKIGATP